jgi:hypothetical protein
MKRRLAVVGFVVLLFGLVAQARSFSDSTLGYSIDVPDSWQVERPSSYEVQFSGNSGAAASAVFSIQNVASTAIGGQYAEVAALVEDLKCQWVAGSGDICIYLGDALLVRDAAGNVLSGPQWIAEYEYGDTVYKEWLAVVAHSSGQVFYVLTYTIPRTYYDAVEPTILDMLGTWTIGASSSTASGTPSSSASSIRVLFEDRGHIGPYDYAADAYDKRLYQVTIPTAGYVALCVVDEPSESISGWILTLGGQTIVQKPGNAADVYTGCYEVPAGTVVVKVGQDTMVTESAFELYLYFSTQPFTIDDLVARFGPRVRTL